jgi:spore germination cell wall hydrolase CwlJ-like protein
MTWAIEVAARTLWQEVRGEPQEGKRAVAHVLWNRVRTGRWGSNLASVCLWRGQFSGWYVPSDPNFKGACLLDDNDNLLGDLTDIIKAAQNEPDPTNGATHYVNLSVVTPSWINGAVHTGKFGHHDFYKGVP